MPLKNSLPSPRESPPSVFPEGPGRTAPEFPFSCQRLSARGIPGSSRSQHPDRPRPGCLGASGTAPAACCASPARGDRAAVRCHLSRHSGWKLLCSPSGEIGLAGDLPAGPRQAEAG